MASLRFKLSDAYRGKDENTKSIFGAPGSSAPGLLELEPRVKQAKRPDGFYGFHIGGVARDPRFEPSPSGSSAGGRNSTGVSVAFPSAVGNSSSNRK